MQENICGLCNLAMVAYVDKEIKRIAADKEINDVHILNTFQIFQKVYLFKFYNYY